ncbi:CopG family transcriptional regulator [bacterium]|nr:CopG family transcriptional regulator [bacterium]
MSDNVKIEVPKSLHDKIEKHIANSKFESVADYILYAARICLLEEERYEASIPEEEKTKIKTKLRDLGYIE